MDAVTKNHKLTFFGTPFPETSPKLTNYRKFNFKVLVESQSLSAIEDVKPSVPIVLEDEKRSLEDPFLDQGMFLEIYGVDALKAFGSHPALRNKSLDELQGTVKFLKARGVQGHLIPKILNHSPEIFLRDPKTELLPVAVYIMERMHVPKLFIGKMFYRCPKILLLKVENLIEHHKFLDSLGLNVGKAVKNNPGLLALNIEEKLIPKMEFFLKLGVEKEKVNFMFQRYPALFVYGLESNIIPKVDYLLNEMDRTLDEVVNFPQYFGYSLDGKIRKRYEYLKSIGKSDMSLMKILVYAEDKFYEMYK